MYLPDEQKLAPAVSSRAGHDYLDLGSLPEDEMLEMLGEPNSIMVTTVC